MRALIQLGNLVQCFGILIPLCLPLFRPNCFLLSPLLLLMIVILVLGCLVKGNRVLEYVGPKVVDQEKGLG
jgi:hypothetical protein